MIRRTFPISTWAPGYQPECPWLNVFIDENGGIVAILVGHAA
jgi:hypothetical protein